MIGIMRPNRKFLGLDQNREPFRVRWIPPDVLRADIQGTISEDSKGHIFHWTPEVPSKVEIVWVTSNIKILNNVSVQIYKNNKKLTMDWISCVELCPEKFPMYMSLDLSVVNPGERLVFQFKNESGLKHYISIHIGRYERG